MLNKGFLLLASLLICLQVQAHPGFRQIALTDRQGEPINVAVWYPAHVGGVTEKVGENAAFVGVSVIPSAPPIQGEHPLLVISHGYNGNWRNLSWIAAAMAMQGYIVAAPDHPGTTTFNQNPADAKQLWRRPQDISQVIDSVISSPGLFGTTDKSRIAALGHSLGGWTVMALAGARFDPVRFSHDCQQRLQRGDCQLEQKFGLDHDALQEKRFTESRDSRIKAVVALDSGLAPGFTPQSLRDISIPVLILAARSDKLAELPSREESGYIADHMDPRWRKFAVIDGATHFSFMQLCKTGAEKLINRESPGDGIVCRDGNGANRADIHQRLVNEISLFLNASLNYPAPADETTSESGLQSAEIPD